ncbi:MAG: hypothetical protein ACREME_02275, partial [Gemmatimonadales bacterium]
MTIGRRLIPLLFVAWALSILVLVVAIAEGYDDIAFLLIGLACVLGAFLLVTPALLFLWYAQRSPAAVPQEMRRAALASGASNAAAGVLLAVALWGIGFGVVLSAPPLAMTALGVAVLARIFTLGPAPVTPAVASPGDPPQLRHRAATIAGLGTIIAFIVLAPRSTGRPSTGPTEANMRNDLRSLVATQDAFHAAHQRYGELAELATFTEHPYRPALSEADITISADSTRFVGTATSPETDRICLVWTGTPVPPPDSVHGA